MTTTATTQSASRRAAFGDAARRACLFAALAAPCTAQFVTEFPITQPGHANQDSLCLGPDGNIWFTYNVPDFELDTPLCALGRITGDGEITITPLPVLAWSAQGGMASDSEGNLWFPVRTVLENKRQLCRRTPGGDFAFFDPPLYCLSVGPNIVGMATGPDGNVWATAGYASMWCVPKILRITPAGQIDAFDAAPGVSGGSPNMITAGPDGALWYTLEGPGAAVDAIARMSTAGTVTAYPLPAEGCHDPYSIVTGSDGALWFTNRFGDGCLGSVGRITTAGAITVLPILAEAWSMLSGPDGHVWIGVHQGISWNGIASVSPADGSAEMLPLPIPRDVLDLERDAQGVAWFISQDWVGEVDLIGKMQSPASLPAPVEGFVSLASVTAQFPAEGPASGVKCKGWIDVGSADVDLDAELTLRVNGEAALTGSPAVKASGKASLIKTDTATLKLSRPTPGASRLTFSFTTADSVPSLTDPDGLFQLGFDFPGLTVQGEVLLTDGGFSSKQTATSTSTPWLHPSTVKAKIGGLAADGFTSKDSITFTAALGALGDKPAESPALDVFMTPMCALSIPAGACKVAGGKFLYSSKLLHPVSISLDWARGLLKVKTSKSSLGEIPDGSSLQTVFVGLDGEFRSVAIQVSRTGAAIKY